jgi:hypothetical protein
MKTTVFNLMISKPIFTCTSSGNCRLSVSNNLSIKYLHDLNSHLQNQAWEEAELSLAKVNYEKKHNKVHEIPQ